LVRFLCFRFGTFARLGRRHLLRGSYSRSRSRVVASRRRGRTRRILRRWSSGRRRSRGSRRRARCRCSACRLSTRWSGRGDESFSTFGIESDRSLKPLPKLGILVVRDCLSLNRRSFRRYRVAGSIKRNETQTYCSHLCVPLFLTHSQDFLNFWIWNQESFDPLCFVYRTSDQRVELFLAEQCRRAIIR